MSLKGTFTPLQRYKMCHLIKDEKWLYKSSASLEKLGSDKNKQTKNKLRRYGAGFTSSS